MGLRYWVGTAFFGSVFGLLQKWNSPLGEIIDHNLCKYDLDSGLHQNDAYEITAFAEMTFRFWPSPE